MIKGYLNECRVIYTSQKVSPSSVCREFSDPRYSIFMRVHAPPPSRFCLVSRDASRSRPVPVPFPFRSRPVPVPFPSRSRPVPVPSRPVPVPFPSRSRPVPVPFPFPSRSRPVPVPFPFPSRSRPVPVPSRSRPVPVPFPSRSRPVPGCGAVGWVLGCIDFILFVSDRVANQREIGAGTC